MTGTALALVLGIVGLHLTPQAPATATSRFGRVGSATAVIGSVWLDEGRLGPRLAGAVVVLAGVACVAVAR
jgi:hypothetical protein